MTTANQKMVSGVDTSIYRPKVLPPRHLSKEAKRVWRRITAGMANDHFNDADFPLLEAYCDLYVSMVEAKEKLGPDGEHKVITNTRGDEVVSPWFTIHQKCCSQVAVFSTKLRLAPSNRMLSKAVRSKPDGNVRSKLGNLIG